MNIAFVAHDDKKFLMENLCIASKHILKKNTVFSTGTTGRRIESATDVAVNKYLAGHLGGEQQLASHITQNEIDLVVYFDDPARWRSGDPEAYAIQRLCDENNIPLATNLATAEAMLLALDRGDLNWRALVR